MADRVVVIKQVSGRRITFATGVIKHARGFRYPLFATALQTKAKRFKERDALKLLDEWRRESVDIANNCSIEPAT